MNKRGETRPADILIGIVVFGFILAAGIAAYANLVVQYEVTDTLDPELKIELQSVYNNTNTLDVETYNSSRDQAPTLAPGDDGIIKRGLNFLDLVGGSIITSGKAVDVVRKSEANRIADEFWVTVIILIGITFVAVVVGAWYRYRMKT